MNLNKLFGTKDKTDSKSDATTSETQITAPATTDEGNTEEVTGTEQTLSTETTVTAEADKTAETDKSNDPYAQWTREQIVKEMQARGQEAAKNRVEKKEIERQLREEYEKHLKSLEEKFSPFVEKANELKKMQDKELDRKRSLEEKLAAREVKIEELLSEKNQVETSLKNEKIELQSQLEKKVADLNAYESYWKEQLEKELALVPQQHKKLADLIVKGAGSDVREALEAIRQAKTDNVFGTKKVTVYNATPNAKQGARMDAASAQKSTDGMSKKDKISQGLNKWKSIQRRRLGGE